MLGEVHLLNVDQGRTNIKFENALIELLIFLDACQLNCNRYTLIHTYRWL
jgi:L-lactate utilization protein LutB